MWKRAWPTISIIGCLFIIVGFMFWFMANTMAVIIALSVFCVILILLAVYIIVKLGLIVKRGDETRFK